MVRLSVSNVPVHKLRKQSHMSIEKTTLLRNACILWWGDPVPCRYLIAPLAMSLVVYPELGGSRVLNLPIWLINFFVALPNT